MVKQKPSEDPKVSPPNKPEDKKENKPVEKPLEKSIDLVDSTKPIEPPKEQVSTAPKSKEISKVEEKVVEKNDQVKKESVDTKKTELKPVQEEEPDSKPGSRKSSIANPTRKDSIQDDKANPLRKDSITGKDDKGRRQSVRVSITFISRLPIIFQIKVS